MVDTNVLFSAILFPQGRAAEALSHCIRKHELVICSYVLDELKRVVRKKFPSRLSELDTFFEKLSFELVYTPEHIEKALFPSAIPKTTLSCILPSSKTSTSFFRVTMTFRIPV